MLAVTILAIVAMTNCQESDYEVVHISEYVRHGARTTFLDKMNYSFTQIVGQGNLTANGMRMQYLLGKQLKEQYPGIFKDKVGWDDVAIYTSSVGRAMTSAVSHLLGMFPLGVGDKITGGKKLPHRLLPPFEGLDVKFDEDDEFALPKGFNPFPFNVKTPEIDLMFLPHITASCPNGNSYLNAKSLELHEKYNYLVSNLSKELEEAGWSARKIYQIQNFTIEKIGHLHDEMMSYLNYYGKLPSTMTQELYHKISMIANINLDLLYPDDTTKRLFSDGIARAIIKNMRSFIYGSSMQKFILYSGHDLGIYSHMLQYGMTSLECHLRSFTDGHTEQGCESIPTYTTSFIYELNMRDGEYFVRTLYNGKPFKICKQDKKSHGYYCKFAEFENTIGDLLYFKGDLPTFCGNPYLASPKSTRSEVIKSILYHRLLFIIPCIVLSIMIILTVVCRSSIEHYVKGDTP